jgi:hypothetical protein
MKPASVDVRGVAVAASDEGNIPEPIAEAAECHVGFLQGKRDQSTK